LRQVHYVDAASRQSGERETALDFAGRWSRSTAHGSPIEISDGGFGASTYCTNRHRPHMAALSTGYSPRAQRLRAVALHANENGSGVERQAHIRLEHVRRKCCCGGHHNGARVGQDCRTGVEHRHDDRCGSFAVSLNALVDAVQSLHTSMRGHHPPLDHRTTPVAPHPTADTFLQAVWTHEIERAPINRRGAPRPTVVAPTVRANKRHSGIAQPQSQVRPVPRWLRHLIQPELSALAQETAPLERANSAIGRWS
jgi:hypothetical protein